MASKVDNIAVTIEVKIANFLLGFATDMLAGWQEIVLYNEVGAREKLIDALAGDIERRVSMSADSFSWQGYQLGRVEKIEERGGMFRWVLDPGADHCNTCIAYAAGGPYTLDTLPGIPGDAPTDCNGGCRCDLIEVEQ